MEKRNPHDIKISETFKSLFPVNPDVLAALEKDMSSRGYDDSLPVVLANWNGQTELVCIDGHTRLQAAINVGIDEVPVFFHELETEDEAIELCIHYQKDRRNITDAEILACVQLLDGRKQRGGDRRSQEAKSMPQSCGFENSRSASARETAKKLGTSARKVEQVRTVMDHADSETIEEVKRGRKTINRACRETQERRKAGKAIVQPFAAQSAPGVDAASESAEKPVVKQKEESIIEDPAADPMGDTSVMLAPEHYRALLELGGTMQYHVACAIDQYLRMAGDEFEEDDERPYGQTKLLQRRNYYEVN